VRYADRIAYLAHDALDAVRAGILTPDQYPRSTLNTLGEPGREWIEAMIASVVSESMALGDIGMSDQTLGVLLELREFMFENVYLRSDAEAQRRRARETTRALVEYYLEHPQEIPDSYRHSDADTLIQVLDYVSGMTDRYALRVHDELFRPSLFLS
jgi:dGTPase